MSSAKSTIRKGDLKNISEVVSAGIQPPQLPVEKLAWQGALKTLQVRVFKIRTPQGHGTGFHIGNFSNNGLCAIATAYHVIDSAHEWGEPFKIVHSSSSKEILLKEKERAVFTYPNRDLAVILFTLPSDLELPTDQIDIIPTGRYLIPGVDVAWCGFPALKSDTLCFFHGYISCHLQGDYLIDGVAINGVSGGPVFYIDNESNQPKIAGVITAYIANRSTGEALPGLSMITSIAPCEETIKGLRSLDEAREEAEKQKQNDIANDMSESDSSL